MQKKYGIATVNPHDTMRYSKYELQKLIDLQKAQEEGSPKQRPIVTPLERASEMIWNDRSVRKNQIERKENLLMGQIGNYAFDVDI